MVRANLVVLAAFAALSISTADDAVLRSKFGAWKEEFNKGYATEAAEAK